MKKDVPQLLTFFKPGKVKHAWNCPSVWSPRKSHCEVASNATTFLLSVISYVNT